MKAIEFLWNLWYNGWRNDDRFPERGGSIVLKSGGRASFQSSFGTGDCARFAWKRFVDFFILEERNMKKLLSLLLALTMVLALAACGNTPAETTTPPVTTAPAESVPATTAPVETTAPITELVVDTCILK